MMSEGYKFFLKIGSREELIEKINSLLTKIGNQKKAIKELNGALKNRENRINTLKNKLAHLKNESKRLEHKDYLHCRDRSKERLDMELTLIDYKFLQSKVKDDKVTKMYSYNDEMNYKYVKYRGKFLCLLFHKKTNVLKTLWKIPSSEYYESKNLQNNRNLLDNFSTR